MCALFGYLYYGRMPAKLLQKLVQALANASEVRGTHAAGIAYNTDNALTIFKRPKRRINFTSEFRTEQPLSWDIRASQRRGIRN